MARILGLQKFEIATDPVGGDNDGSTSSWGGCACSTNSATGCRLEDEFVAV